MNAVTQLTAPLLRQWAEAHRRDATRLRTEAARMLDEARDRERKGTDKPS